MVDDALQVKQHPTNDVHAALQGPQIKLCELAPGCSFGGAAYAAPLGQESAAKHVHSMVAGISGCEVIVVEKQFYDRGRSIETIQFLRGLPFLDKRIGAMELKEKVSALATCCVVRRGRIRDFMAKRGDSGDNVLMVNHGSLRIIEGSHAGRAVGDVCGEAVGEGVEATWTDPWDKDHTGLGGLHEGVIAAGGSYDEAAKASWHKAGRAGEVSMVGSGDVIDPGPPPLRPLPPLSCVLSRPRINAHLLTPSASSSQARCSESPAPTRLTLKAPSVSKRPF